MSTREHLVALGSLFLGWLLGLLIGWYKGRESVPVVHVTPPPPDPPPPPVAFETLYKIGARVKCHLGTGAYFVGTIVDFESEWDGDLGSHVTVRPDGLREPASSKKAEKERLWGFTVGSPEIVLIPPEADPGYREAAKPAEDLAGELARLPDGTLPESQL